MTETATPEMVKVRWSDADGFTETPWASRVKPDDDLFRVENAPFYAHGVSFEDVVEAKPLGPRVADGVPMYEFVRVAQRSGNRKVRFNFGDDKADTPAGRRVLDAIEGPRLFVRGNVQHHDVRNSAP
jgi:hypothetical protein